MQALLSGELNQKQSQAMHNELLERGFALCMTLVANTLANAADDLFVPLLKLSLTSFPHIIHQLEANQQELFAVTHSPMKTKDDAKIEVTCARTQQ